tara:strand:+ start:39 stop:470 length:432 start_codon:yes stop_codon:yes gene_type:complete
MAKKAKKKATKKATKKVVKKVVKKATKKKTAKKSAASVGAYKSGKSPITKSQIAASLAEIHDLKKKQVTELLATLFDEIVPAELKKHKKINLLSLIKLSEKKKPARKARKGVNPFTGEAMTFKAKPASKTVKAVALKKLKEMV